MLYMESHSVISQLVTIHTARVGQIQIGMKRKMAREAKKD